MSLALETPDPLLLLSGQSVVPEPENEVETREGWSTCVPTGTGPRGWGLCSFSKFRMRCSKDPNPERLNKPSFNSHHPVPPLHLLDPPRAACAFLDVKLPGMWEPSISQKVYPSILPSQQPLPQGFNVPLSLELHRTQWTEKLSLETESGTLFSGSLGCYPHLPSPSYIKVSSGSGPIWPVQNPFLGTSW